MANSILITGGAASRKSRFAITHFSAFDYVLYLKAGATISPDTLGRIEFDNKRHGVQWDVVQLDRSIPGEMVYDHKFVIFDSLATYTRMVLTEMTDDEDSLNETYKKAIEKQIIDNISEMRQKVMENQGSIIIITVETGFSNNPGIDKPSAFQEILGRVNQRIANSSDEVYFSASGIQFKIR